MNWKAIAHIKEIRIEGQPTITEIDINAYIVILQFTLVKTVLELKQHLKEDQNWPNLIDARNVQ